MSEYLYNYQVLLPHPNEPRLLFTTDNSGNFMLLGWQSNQRRLWQEVDHINAGVAEKYGVTVTTLRCLNVNFGATAATFVYEVENHAPLSAAMSGQWFTFAEFNKLSLAPEVEPYRVYISDWYAEAATGRSPKRKEWMRPGWFNLAATWLGQTLRTHGFEPIGNVEQLRTWERSALLRVPTNAGFFYFKALPGVFHHELELLQWLNREFPGKTPALVASDAPRGWLLMPDLGSDILDRQPDLTLWEAALADFARLQIALSNTTAELIAVGCPLSSLAELPDRYAHMLNDKRALYPEPGVLLPVEVEKLRELLPRFRQDWARLAQYAIPDSLEHGDFWTGNISRDANGNFVFFDWSDSTIAQPFFSLALFLANIEQELPGVPDAYARLRAAYLAPWQEFLKLGADALTEAFELAQNIAPVHLALGYYERILPAFEARWEMHLMIPFYLRQLLARYEKAV
jgi:hypothetical protein